MHRRSNLVSFSSRRLVSNATLAVSRLAVTSARSRVVLTRVLRVPELDEHVEFDDCEKDLVADYEEDEEGSEDEDDARDRESRKTGENLPDGW